MEALTEKLDDTEIGVWVITLIEMAPGAARADTAERKSKREKSIDELVMAVPVFPVTVPIARRTGQLDGENQARGLQVPLPDLLIGVTALELGYSVGTAKPPSLQAGCWTKSHRDLTTLGMNKSMILPQASARYATRKRACRELRVSLLLHFLASLHQLRNSFGKNLRMSINVVRRRLRAH